MSECIHADVVVVGAGVSGLATAHLLSRRGLQVRLVEQLDRPGGPIRTSRIDGFLIEHGPNSGLDTTPLLHQLFAEAGVADQLEYAGPQAANRYIVRHGRLHALPASPPAFFRSDLFTTRAKIRLLAEPFIRRSPAEADETLAAFVERRLGREFLDYAIDAFVAGVFAGRPEDLSVRSAFPKLHALEQEYGSLIKGAVLGARRRRKSQETSKQSARMFSFKEGLQTLIDALARPFGQDLHTGVRVRTIRALGPGYTLDLESGGRPWQLVGRALLLTIPAHAYEDLDLAFDFPLIPALRQIPYPPVAGVYFGYRHHPANRALDGFGFLIPRLERFQILGTIWSSTVFTNRAPAGGAALTTFVGGTRQPEHALWPDGRLVDAVRQDLGRLMGIQDPPDEVAIHRWPRAIPQYQVGHRAIMEAVEAFERQRPGLYLSGNFRGGISLADCVKQAYAMAERVAGDLSASGESPS